MWRLALFTLEAFHVRPAGPRIHSLTPGPRLPAFVQPRRVVRLDEPIAPPPDLSWAVDPPRARYVEPAGLTLASLRAPKRRVVVLHEVPTLPAYGCMSTPSTPDYSEVGPRGVLDRIWPYGAAEYVPEFVYEAGLYKSPQVRPSELNQARREAWATQPPIVRGRRRVRKWEPR